MSWSDVYVEQMAIRFKALGEPARLRIIEALRKTGDQPVNELASITGLSQANLSKHLQLLHGAGLVRRRREGLYVYYSLADNEIASLCDLMCGRVDRDAMMGREGSGQRIGS